MGGRSDGGRSGGGRSGSVMVVEGTFSMPSIVRKKSECGLPQREVQFDSTCHQKFECVFQRCT